MLYTRCIYCVQVVYICCIHCIHSINRQKLKNNKSIGVCVRACACKCVCVRARVCVSVCECVQVRARVCECLLNLSLHLKYFKVLSNTNYTIKIHFRRPVDRAFDKGTS